ncbi:hypothetical protein FZW96_07370 [Bacillus sp. BGMRC 2118]|nr:hypothetical protein FZW96_07370 [Bacillus sp. BGMRC 2118]
MMNRLVSCLYVTLIIFLVLQLFFLFLSITTGTEEPLVGFILVSFMAILHTFTIFPLFLLFVPISFFIDWLTGKVNITNTKLTYFVKLSYYILISIFFAFYFNSNVQQEQLPTFMIYILSAMIALIYFHSLYIVRKEWISTSAEISSKKGSPILIMICLMICIFFSYIFWVISPFPVLQQLLPS